jgi:stage II sporulation protein M
MKNIKGYRTEKYGILFCHAYSENRSDFGMQGVHWYRVNSFMDRKKKRAGQSTYPAAVLYLTGFLLGCLLPNLFWKNSSAEHVLAGGFLLQFLRQGEMGGKEFLREVLIKRGCEFALLAFGGPTIFGVPLSVIWMMLVGGWMGLLLTLAVLEFGLYGILYGLGMLLPQYLVHLPVWFALLPMVYAQSQDIWRKRGILPRKMFRYGGCVLLLGILTLAGIFLETYGNPRFLGILLKKFPI